jgi:hypothetical protein
MESINLVLITSVINPPNRPLSYSSCRSIYSPNERFIQTQKTISSIREKILNSKIFIAECSQLTSEQETYLTANSDYYINLFNSNQRDDIYGISKSLGEGTMTINALDYITYHIMPNFGGININFFKISGRYWLNDNFNYYQFINNDNDNNNNLAVFKQIEGNPDNIFTALYKLPGKMINHLYNFLTNQHIMHQMRHCIGYEVLFAQFLRGISGMTNIKYIDPIGLSGNITIDGSFYNG